MNAFVYNIFKTVALSIIIFFVFDVLSYLVNALTFNQRMLTLMNSMQRIVMENNYLPEGDAKMFQDGNGKLGDGLFDLLEQDYTPKKIVNGNTILDASRSLVDHISMNYGSPSTGGLTTLKANKYSAAGALAQTNILKRDMSKPANYGDIMVVEVIATINQPTYKFVPSSDPDAEAKAAKFLSDANGTAESAKVSNVDIDSSMYAGSSLDHTQTEFVYRYYVPCLKYLQIQE